ncbi:MAG TPA: hypothetical protein DIW30_01110 [Bacteroidales bacterium]|nr:hypothetical protein [Bacteroidales bacterium]
MATEIENIGKRDVAWGLIATVFMIGAGVILMPFILYKMPAETVGIWNVFLTITSLVALLDFGFQPSFARNISYIFSGARHLQKEGVEVLENEQAVDYGLLKTTIKAMRIFYRRMALVVLIPLGTAGTAYMYLLMNKYTGDKTDVLVAWLLLIGISCYNLYTMYYEALLTGKGYIKRMQQINILGQSSYIVLGVILIYSGLGLTAIVGSQLVSVIVRRSLYKRVFFTKPMREELDAAEEQDIRPILHAIVPNATKMGLTNLGGFVITRSSILIGSALLPLTEMAMYGLTFQVIAIIGRCASVMYVSYIPKLAQYRVQGDKNTLKRLFLRSELFMVVAFIAGGVSLLFLGDWALDLIKSDTKFLPFSMTLVMIIAQMLEHCHIIASGFILSNNKIPFFIPSLVSAGATLILLTVFLHWTSLGLWGLILAPAIAQLAYQNWKWPSMVVKELYSQPVWEK